MSAPILDFYDDHSGALLALIAEESGLPLADTVKQAGMIPSAAIRNEGLAFAWPVMKLFRVDTPLDTVLSRGYFEKNAHLIEAGAANVIDQNLSHAESVYGIDRILVKRASTTPPEPAAAPLRFALTIPREQGEEGVKSAAQYTESTLSLYPINNTREVAAGQSFYPGSLDGKLAAYRWDVAAALLKAGAQEGIVPNSRVEDGAGWAHPLVVQDGLEYRSHLAKQANADPRLIAVYEKLATDTFVPAGHIQESRQLAEIVRILDNATGLDKVAGLIPWYEFARPFNRDLGQLNVKLANQSVPLSAILSLDPTTLTNLVPHIADAFTNQIKQAAAIEAAPLRNQQAILYALQAPRA